MILEKAQVTRFVYSGGTFLGACVLAAHILGAVRDLQEEPMQDCLWVLQDVSKSNVLSTCTDIQNVLYVLVSPELVRQVNKMSTVGAFQSCPILV